MESSKTKNPKDLLWLRNNLIAHRGFHSKDKSVPENSLLAYKKAIDKGYSIELDINILKDGTIVAFHDPSLKRLCGINKLLSTVTFNEIKHLKLLNTNEKIPKLSDVLDLVNGNMPLLIEIKPFGDYFLMCQSLMTLMKDYQGVWAVFSFHPRIVQWFKKNHPHIIRGQISEFFTKDEKMNPLNKYFMKTMIYNKFSSPDFISYGIYDMPNKHLDKLKKKGLTIIGYAAKTQEQLDFVKIHYHNTVFEFFDPKKKAPR